MPATREASYPEARTLQPMQSRWLLDSGSTSNGAAPE